MPPFGKDTFVRIRLLGGSGSYILAPVLTTAQRNALTAAAGMVIYNSTTTQLEIYNGAAWVAVGKLYGDATFLPLAGGTMTGNIAMAGAQTVDGVDLSALNTAVYQRVKLLIATRDMTLASGNVSYAGVGFKPRFLLFFGALGANAVISQGCADENGEIASLYNNFGDSNYYCSSSYALRLAHALGDQWITAVTMDADGFTVSWVKSNLPTGTGSFAVLAVG